MANLTTYEGASVELDCTATGDPEPKMEWFRDSVPIQFNMQYILKDDGVLLLPHVAANQSGYYTCQAMNYAGSESHSFWVNVVSKSRVLSLLGEETMTFVSRRRQSGDRRADRSSRCASVVGGESRRC